MPEQSLSEEDGQATYLEANGWHRDPAEQRRWRNPAYPSLEPQTLMQAVEIQRNAAGGAHAGGPNRVH